MTEWTLLRPWFLLLFCLPLLLLALKWRDQRKGQSLISSRLLGYLGVDPLLKPQDFSYLKLSLKLIVWALAIIAMAGPAHRQQSDLYEQDETWIWLMDVSQSMWADDTPPSRLIRSRYYLQQLLEQAQGRRIALIAFAGDAYVVSPPTDDADTLRYLLRELTPEVMPLQGSNPVAALQRGLSMLDQIRLAHGRLTAPACNAPAPPARHLRLRRFRTASPRPAVWSPLSPGCGERARCSWRPAGKNRGGC